MNFSAYGLSIPNFLLPNHNIDLSKWAVVACDQYTSEPNYWTDLAAFVGTSPSTLDIIFPEAFLNQCDNNEKILKINNNMDDYMSNILTRNYTGFVLVERVLPSGPVRTGLLACIDLDAYEYTPGNQALIRATEATVIDRLPPRMAIRQNASLELPHVLVLCNDPDLKLIEPLSASKSDFEKLYDFDLNQNGGHISGYLINYAASLNQISEALHHMSKNNFMFAVGDGNHSLATAKSCWENIKSTLTENERLSHPARFSLVELVNLYDEGIVFEPIHRALFNIDLPDLLSFIHANNHSAQTMSITYYSNDQSGTIQVPIDPLDDRGASATKSLQDILDAYLKQNPNAQIDYIHGDDVAASLGKKEGNISFLLPAMDKTAFFTAVELHGVLTRKTFSMGEANEKRYYLECRKIK